MAADPMTRQTVDDLLLQDDGFDWDDDPFADHPANKTNDRDDKAVLSPRKRKADDDKENFALGLDEEIKITKKRKPIAKLDTEKLLSQPGIPKIREVVRSNGVKRKLKLKGKGHEFSDCARLLNYYQLWADNLYPRAKFAGALQLIEKAGHTKRMQVMRKAWIDEGKPSYVRDHDLAEEVKQLDKAEHEEQLASTTGLVGADTIGDDVPDDDAMFFADARPSRDDHQIGPDDDELDALLAQEDEATRPVQMERNRTTKSVPIDDDSEGEDDLDALLAAEQDLRNGNNVRSVQTIPIQQGESQDDLEAIPNEYDSFELEPILRVGQGEEEEDDLDALLNEEDSFVSSSNAPALPSKSAIESGNNKNKDHSSQPSSPSEPELPLLPSPQKALNAKTANQEPTLPGSSEVPELSTMISSSPIPNIHTDDLDAMMDEMEDNPQQNSIGPCTPAKSTTTVSNLGLGGDILSSSPIPNEHGNSQ